MRLLVAIAILQVLCESSEIESRLYRSLFNGYNRHVRPVRDHTQPVQVHIGLSLIEILGLDEFTNRLSVKVWLHLNWKDEYLSWNPVNFQGIPRLNVETASPAKLWLPDVTVYNAVHTDNQGLVTAGGTGETGYLDTWTMPQAVITSDGTVTWVRQIVVSVTTRHEFRANSWIATLRVGSWTYEDNRLKLVATSSTSLETPGVDFDVSNYAAGDQWTLLEHSGRRVETMSMSSGGKVLQANQCCSQNVFVSFNYGLKLRKKKGPSLIVGG